MRGRRVKCGLLTAAALATAAIAAAACGSSHDGAGPGRRFGAADAAAPLAASSAYLLMTAPAAGWAILPSGGAWLLVQTSDGFAHVANRTPAGVETDGGLVAALGPAGAAVAVEAHDRLRRSPLLTSSADRTWLPTELPDAVADARGAVSTGADRTTVVTAGGAVLARAGTGWRELTRAAALPGGAALRIDAVTWSDASLGWLTTHGAPGQPLAFRTADGGATWSPVPGSGGPVVATLAPCGAGRSWLLPVIDSSGALAVLRTTDGGGTWARGAGLRVAAGRPAWSCRGTGVWMTARVDRADRVLSSTDSGATWTDRGAAPPGLSDLAMTGPGTGFAVSGGDHPTLWSVQQDGARFTPVPLPGWVGTLGGYSGGH